MWSNQRMGESNQGRMGDLKLSMDSQYSKLYDRNNSAITVNKKIQDTRIGGTTTEGSDGQIQNVNTMLSNEYLNEQYYLANSINEKN